MRRFSIPLDQGIPSDVCQAVNGFLQELRVPENLDDDMAADFVRECLSDFVANLWIPKNLFDVQTTEIAQKCWRNFSQSIPIQCDSAANVEAKVECQTLAWAF